MRSIISLSAGLVLAGCGDPFDERLADAQLTEYLASAASTESTLANWIGADDVVAVCFLDEFESADSALTWRASLSQAAPDLPLEGLETDVPEGALGVLAIGAERSTFALVSQRYLFEPGACYRPDAVLRRSEEDQTRWVVAGEKLPNY